jgi:hypothetical protein
MALVEIEWHPSPPQLRKFGVAMLVGFGVLALLAELWLGRRTLALVFACVGLGTGLLGLTGTRAALPIYWAWMGIAFVLGNITTRVLVGAFYFAMLAPLGLGMRLFGRDRMRRKRPAGTMWVDLPPSERDPKRYERQF